MNSTKTKKIKAISIVLAAILLGIIAELAAGAALIFGRSSSYYGGVVVYRVDDPAGSYMTLAMHAFIFVTVLGMTVIYWKSKNNESDRG